MKTEADTLLLLRCEAGPVPTSVFNNSANSLESSPSWTRKRARRHPGCSKISARHVLRITTSISRNRPSRLRGCLLSLFPYRL